MRAIFGVLGLLVALGIVGLLVKKQLAATRQALPALALPASASPDGGATKPATAVQEQSQQVQQQYKQALEAAMQQARPVQDENK
ncbi:hypothetical protein [Polaromonas jejuensis]|uniref:Uncharacterized protein n=1 Tax=Polaromonas jejuensis TaxID=457502 RepID=A0ABW0QD73_9BURK|nr:hypothetical protein [Polaromonas jejuensis]